MKRPDIIKNLVYVTIAVVLTGLTLVNCKRQKPRYDEIERVQNETHSIIWKCSECQLGLGYSVLCGTSVPISVSLECLPCVEGFNFSNRHDYSQCNTCMKCADHELTSGHCTTEEDTTKCLGTCSKGFYWNNLTDSCHPCSVCCEGNITDHEKQCESSSLPLTHQCRQTSLNCTHPLNSGQNASHEKELVHEDHPKQQTLPWYLIVVMIVISIVIVLVVLVLVVMWRCCGCQRAKNILRAIACFCCLRRPSAKSTDGLTMYFNHNENDTESFVGRATEIQEASDTLGSLKSARVVGKRPGFKRMCSVPADVHPIVSPEFHRSKSHPGALKDLNTWEQSENEHNVREICANDRRRKKCGKKQYTSVPTTEPVPASSDQGHGAKSIHFFGTTDADSDVPDFTDQAPCANTTATADSEGADLIDLGSDAQQEEKQRLLSPCTLDAKDQSPSSGLHHSSNTSLSLVPQDFQRCCLKKKMSDIPIEFYKKICYKLDVLREPFWDDYRLLGEKIDLTKDEVSFLGQKRDPTNSIIQKFNSQRNSSVGKFRTFLEEMERSDVVTIINEWIIDKWNNGM